MKEYGTITNLPREGHPPKLTDQARRALIREATKRPKITMKELQSSTAEIGVSVHRTTLSHTLHRAGLLRKSGQKKSHCLKKEISKHVLCSPEGIWETPQTYGRRHSGQMRIKLSFLSIKETLCLAQTQHLSSPREHHLHSEAWCWEHHDVGIFFISRDWETGQNLSNDAWL